MVLNVYLIRHAETDFNKENSGFLQADNIKLNSQGLTQLKDLSKIFTNIKLDKIYSSDLTRAEETVKFVFGKDNKSIVLDKRLREYTHGSVSPDSEEWKNKYKELFDKGMAREDIRPFGGENIWDLIKRVTSFLRDIEKLNGNIVIVSHSGVNEVLLNISQKKKKEGFFKIKQDNACINHLRYENNEWKILTINDTKHLDNLKPEIECYENITEINNMLINFLKEKALFNSKDVLAIGDLSKGKIGKYKRVFRRYFGTPLTIVAEVSKDKIKKEWKIVTLLEDYSEYEIGELILKGAKHKINLIVPKNYKEFILKNEIKKIGDYNEVAKPIKQKALSFIYNSKSNKFLLKDSKGIINKEIKENESHEKVIEEAIKEFGLDIEEVFPLKWGSVYNLDGEEFKEMNFLSFVNDRKIFDYKWLNLEEFIKQIDWKDNKKLLKKVLEKAIKREVYFNKKEREQ
ncbi:MAG: histidine phosphatase family protein [Nanoarchaeota archaeon]|nr:histidine phosphatase family protein [Nanoarchaeota archaeon]